MHTAAKIMAVVAAALTLASCGQKQDAASSSSPSTSAKSPASPTTTALPTQSKGKECTADDITTTGKFGEKPTITIPDSCDPPKKLITKDLSVGTGPAAKTGDVLGMNYLLVTWSDKKVLDNSFDRGQLFDLNLGAGEVIKGWDQGLVGIKEGSRRLLIIPPDLAYGQGGRGILPNETLVFVTDAVKLTPKA